MSPFFFFFFFFCAEMKSAAHAHIDAGLKKPADELGIWLVPAGRASSC